MDAHNGSWARAALLGATLLVAAPRSLHAADLVVGAFGGVWEQSLRHCIIDPWQKQTGKTADVALGSAVQILNQAAASPGRPPVDVLYNATETSYEAIDRGLVDKFTPAEVPNMTKVAPEFARITGGYGSVHNYGAMGLIYNTTTLKDPPKTWKDFVAGVIAGKYHAAMPSVNYPNAGLTVSVWWFAKLFGGDVHHIEPGLDQIRKMRDSGNLQFWSDPNQVLNALRSGDVDIALYWDGRAWAFIDSGNKDFKYYTPEPGAVVAMTWIQKLKGGSDLAYSFANYALSKEAQSCFGSMIRYGIANGDAKIDPKVADEITPRSDLVFPPYEEVNKLSSKWIEAWNKQIGR